MIVTKIRSGTVTITDETVQLNTSPLGALKRLHEQNILIVPFLIVIMVLAVDTSMSDSSPIQYLGKFVVIFAISAITFEYIYKYIGNSIKNASEIPRNSINHIEYTTGSKLLAPKLYIVVEKEKKTKKRPVFLSLQSLGGDQELKNAIEAFEEAGIAIVPADETPDENS
ncbi:hypothetical protein [Halocatena halophila]|uniref:hypothetical protein n=1 Tax=Halocatena halophila TaxID=2814576 RepID=UPI002ED45EA1